MPPRSIGKRISALLWAGAETGAEHVMLSNGIASLAIGGYCLFETDLPLLLSLALTPATFVFLTVCLFHRRMVWIATALGSLVNAGVGVATLIALTHKLHPLAPWVAGPLGFVAGAAASIWAYRDVGRLTHD